MSFALKIDDITAKGALPSLYLNIGKCYEDLHDLKNAKSNYFSAKSHFDFLPANGYGTMKKREWKAVLKELL